MEKFISIFGSYKPVPGDNEYDIAFKTSFELVKKGFSIINGGGTGIMEAASLGAKKAGGKSIGVVLKTLKTNPGSFINNEIIECNTLFERLEKLTIKSSGFIIFSGGTGTLVELSLVWELINKNLIKNTPVICFGTYWKPIVESILTNPYYIKNKTSNIIKFASTINEILNNIQINIPEY